MKRIIFTLAAVLVSAASFGQFALTLDSAYQVTGGIRVRFSITVPSNDSADFRAVIARDEVNNVVVFPQVFEAVSTSGYYEWDFTQTLPGTYYIYGWGNSWNPISILYTDTLTVVIGAPTSVLELTTSEERAGARAVLYDLSGKIISRYIISEDGKIPGKDFLPAGLYIERASKNEKLFVRKISVP
jgi:hypothetical protein